LNSFETETAMSIQLRLREGTYQIDEGEIGHRSFRDRREILRAIAGYLDVGLEQVEDLRIEVLPGGEILARSAAPPSPCRRVLFEQ